MATFIPAHAGQTAATQTRYCSKVSVTSGWTLRRGRMAHFVHRTRSAVAAPNAPNVRRICGSSRIDRTTSARSSAKAKTNSDPTTAANAHSNGRLAMQNDDPLSGQPCGTPLATRKLFAAVGSARPIVETSAV